MNKFTTSSSSPGWVTKTVKASGIKTYNSEVTDCENHDMNPDSHGFINYVYGKYPNGEAGWDYTCVALHMGDYVLWASSCGWCNACQSAYQAYGGCPGCPITDPNPLNKCYGPLYDEAMVAVNFDLTTNLTPVCTNVDLSDTTLPPDEEQSVDTFKIVGDCAYTGPLGDVVPEEDRVWSSPTVKYGAGPAPDIVDTVATVATYVSDDSANYPGWEPLDPDENLNTLDDPPSRTFVWSYTWGGRWKQESLDVTLTDSHYCV